jgi:hypothetical protein
MSRLSKQLPRLKTWSSIAKRRDALTRSFMAAAMFAPAERARAVLALVFFFRASRGGRRVGCHVSGCNGGMRVWPTVVDAVRCLDGRRASGVKACWWWVLNEGSRNLSFREMCARVMATAPGEPMEG